MEKIDADATQKLIDMKLVAAEMNTCVVIAESGKLFLAENMNNRGVA